MKINVPVKWRDTASIDADEALTRRVLNLDDESNENVIYVNGVMTLDTDDIRNWNAGENNCTTIRTYQEDAYNVCIPFEEFNSLWTQVTGQTIMQVRLEEKKSRKSSR